MFFESSFFNGINRGRVVIAGNFHIFQVIFQILQAFPLGSNGIEEGWANGGGGLPVENPDVV